MNYAYLAATATALVLGFLAGLLTFKRSNRWCQSCGYPLACKANCGKRPGRQRPLGVGHGADRGSLDT